LEKLNTDEAPRGNGQRRRKKGSMSKRIHLALADFWKMFIKLIKTLFSET